MKKGREGPGRCSLCKLEAETNFHLGVECPFTQSVWLNIEEKLRIKNLWSGDSVINCMKTRCLNMEVKNIISLPIIVLWFIWKAINQSCFEDNTLLPSQVSLFSLGLLNSFSQDNLVVKIISVVVENIDKSYPWGYFDGSRAW